MMRFDMILKHVQTCHNAYNGTTVSQQLPNGNWNFGIEEK